MNRIYKGHLYYSYMSIDGTGIVDVREGFRGTLDELRKVLKTLKQDFFDVRFDGWDA